MKWTRLEGNAFVIEFGSTRGQQSLYLYPGLAFGIYGHIDNDKKKKWKLIKGKYCKASKLQIANPCCSGLKFTKLVQTPLAETGFEIGIFVAMFQVDLSFDQSICLAPKISIEMISDKEYNFELSTSLWISRSGH